MFKINCTLVIITLFSVSAFSQSWMYKDAYLLDFKNRHEIGIFAGVATYQGDLHGFTDKNLSLTSEINAAFGLNYTLNIINQFSVGLSYFTTKLSGSDANFDELWHQRRGFSFTNQIHEFSLRVDYEPFQLQNSKFMPYVFGGVGFTTGDSKTDFESGNYNDKWTTKIAQDIQNRTNTSFTVPLGLGMRYYLSSKVSIKLEGSFRVGMNDYLDGVSISGNSSSNDSYGTVGFGFTYGFGQAPSKERVIKVKPTGVLNK